MRKPRMDRQEMEARVGTADVFSNLIWNAACDLFRKGDQDSQRLAVLLQHLQPMFTAQLYGTETERLSRAQAMVDLAIAGATK